MEYVYDLGWIWYFDRGEILSLLVEVWFFLLVYFWGNVFIFKCFECLKVNEWIKMKRKSDIRFDLVIDNFYY